MEHRFSFPGRLRDAVIEFDGGAERAEVADLLAQVSRAWTDSQSAEFSIDLTISGHISEGDDLEIAARLQGLREALQRLCSEPIIPKYKQLTIRGPRKPAKAAA